MSTKTIGLTIAEDIPTQIGMNGNGMVRIKDYQGKGTDNDGNTIADVLFVYYQGRTEYDNGDGPLQTLAFDHRAEISINSGIEVSTTSAHDALQPVLEGRGYTVTKETTS